MAARRRPWRRKVYATAEVDAYTQKVAATGIEPAFIHGLYLVNLATDSPDLLSKSYDALVADMEAAQDATNAVCPRDRRGASIGRHFVQRRFELNLRTTGFATIGGIVAGLKQWLKVAR